MGLSFSSPWALLLLLLLPPVLMLGWGRAPARRQKRTVTGLALRAAILLLLILSLAGAQTVRTADDLAVVFLVDASDSISAEQAAAAEAFVREAIAGMTPNDQAAVVVFGANALVDRPMSRLAELSAITSIPQTLQTDIAEAIRLGLAIFPAGSARRLVVLSDGAATAGDTEGAARLAAASGVPIDYVPLLRGETAAESWLTRVAAPTRVTVGQVFNLDISAESTVNTPATLRVLAGGQIVSEEAVQLRPGVNHYSIRLQAAEQEFARYTVQLTAAGDTYYQNNQLSAFTEITGPPRVLLVASDGTLDDDGEPLPAAAAQLEAALRAAGLLVDRITPADLPANFAELSNYASVILVDINAKRLTPRKMEALQSYVRDLGGGLVAIGGPESYGMGGYFKTPLEETLPVDMQIKDEERFPSVSIVIVIDRSGSMAAAEGGLSKIQLASEGAVRVVELLNDFDEITVIPVDTQPSGQVGPLPASRREEAIAQIRRIGAGGGGIFVRTGLEAAEAALAESSNQVRHIILLADGADSEEKDGVPELIDRLVEDGVTVSTVSIGNGPDVAWLQQMAERGQGRFHFTDRAANLPQIFTQETTAIQRSYLIEEPFFPELARSSPILSGIRSVPSLGGYVGTSAKGTAQVVLRTHLEDPLLATWQYGLGRAVAWTSDATARWATRWIEWEGFPVFWAQAVRWTITANRGSAVETIVTLQGETAGLSVDARTPEGIYLNGLEMEASIVSPGGRDIDLALQQTAPGRYQAAFTPDEEGAYFLRVAGGEAAAGTVVGQTTGWVLGYSPEYQRLEANPQLLARLAAQTGGRDLGGVTEAVFEHNLPNQSTTRPIWPWLLLVAVILLPFDIAVRRLAFTRRDRERLWAATLGRLRPEPPPPAPRSEQMSSLFQAKSRAREQRSLEAPADLPPPAGEVRPAPRVEAPPPRSEDPAPGPPAAPPAPESDQSLAARLMQKKRAQQDREDPSG